MVHVIHMNSLPIVTTLRTGIQQMTTLSAARSVLLKFKPRNNRLVNGREAWLALKNKYQNTCRQRKRILLRRLDNSAMMSDIIDSDVFLSEVFQLQDELNDLDETVTDERLTTIILDALPEAMYPTVTMQLVRDPVRA